MRNGFGLSWLVLPVVVGMGCTKVIEQPRAEQTPTYADQQQPVTRVAKNAPLSNNKSWGLANRNQVAPSIGKSQSGARIVTANRPPQTLNGDPEGLSREALQQALSGVLGTVARCFAGTEATSAVVSFEADPSGSTRSIRVSGAPAPTADCVSGIVAQVRFPAFKGTPVPVDYPISVHTTTAAAPKPAGDEAQPPSAFVNP